MVIHDQKFTALVHSALEPDVTSLIDNFHRLLCLEVIKLCRRKSHLSPGECLYVSS